MKMTAKVHLWISLLTTIFYAANSACPNGWDTFSSMCYKVIKHTSSFTDVRQAREICAAESGDMATIGSEDIDYTLRENLNAAIPSPSSRPEYFYFGLTDVNVQASYVSMHTNATQTFTNFGTSPGPDVCFAVRSQTKAFDNSTKWVDVSCCFNTLAIDAVACEKPESTSYTGISADDVLNTFCHGDCPTSWYKYNGKCYGMVTDSTTLSSVYKGRQMCQTFTGHVTDLISISLPVYVLISNIMQAEGKGSSDYVVIGNNDVATESTYKALQGNTDYTTPDKWSVDTANSAELNCIQIRSDDWSQPQQAKWHRVDCCTAQNTTFVVCEKDESSDYATIVAGSDVFASKCNIDDCPVVNPCLNSGNCTDGIGDYSCSCEAAYTGQHCETSLPVCDYNNPCQNSAICRSNPQGVICECAHAGFTGAYCETLLDPCPSEPCQNQGTCSGDSSGYTCACLNGTSGLNCETNIDDCVDVNCNTGQCVDEIDNYRCQCTSGYTGTHCESEIACPTIDPMENATMTSPSSGSHGTSFLSTVTLQCKQPWMKFPDMKRSRTHTCKSDNNWDPPLADCTAHCAYIPQIANTELDPKSTTMVGTTLNYTCLKGHKFGADNASSFSISCEPPYGNWSINPADLPTECEIVKCPVLPTYENQKKENCNNTYGTKCIFWCMTGTELPDKTIARSIKCKENGKWSAQLPSCSPVKCDKVSSPKHCQRDTDAHEFGVKTTYECDPGYRMEDGAKWKQILCDALGQWTDKVTNCEANRCPPLPYFDKATPNSFNATEGSEIIFTCNRGHQFLPQKRSWKKIECVRQRWTPTPNSLDDSKCQPVQCPVLVGSAGEIAKNLLEHVSADSMDRLYGDEVNLVCDRGHYFSDNTSSFPILCQENEQWNISDSELRDKSCFPAECPIPTDVTNGTRYLTQQQYFYLDKVYYKCDGGFKFIDGFTERNITCNEFGNWDVPELDCQKERCDPVPFAANTVTDTTDTAWHTNVTFTCQLGYKWPGNEVQYKIKCNVGGLWSTDNIPGCDPKVCAPIHTVLVTNATHNASELVQSDREFNSVIEFTCDDGTKYRDDTKSKTKRCNEDGIWWPRNEDFLECEIMHCPELPPIENATLSSNDTSYHADVKYISNAGYQFADKDVMKTIKCEANGTVAYWEWFCINIKWGSEDNIKTQACYDHIGYIDPRTGGDPQFPTFASLYFCEIVFCPPVPYWANALFNSSDNDHNAVISYICEEGYDYDTGKKIVKANVKGMAVTKAAPVATTTAPLEEKISRCNDSKMWEPPIQSCIPISSIGDGVIGVTTEAPAAQNVGGAAIAFMTVFIVSVVLLDLNKIKSDIQQGMKNCKEFKNCSKQNKVSDSQQCMGGMQESVA